MALSTEQMNHIAALAADLFHGLQAQELGDGFSAQLTAAAMPSIVTAVAGDTPSWSPAVKVTGLG